MDGDYTHGDVAEPHVSILTPTYRHGRFLRACIDSVRTQTYSNWEMLVREDGPPDRALLGHLEDMRIRYEGQERRGIWRLGETYNELLAQAHGSLVAILEGDDLWPAEKLTRQVALLEAHPDVVLSFGRAIRVDEDGRELSTWPLVNVPENRPFDARGTLLYGCPIAAVTVMVRRDALERVGGFIQPSGMPAVDYPTWTALAAEGPFIATSELVGLWRIHGGNASSEHVVALTRASRDLALAHAHPAERRAVRRHWRRVESDVQRAVGRSALEQREWQRARAAFTYAAEPRQWNRPLSLLKALAGLCLAALHVPLPRSERRVSDA